MAVSSRLCKFGMPNVGLNPFTKLGACKVYDGAAGCSMSRGHWLMCLVWRQRDHWGFGPMLGEVLTGFDRKTMGSMPSGWGHNDRISVARPAIIAGYAFQVKVPQQMTTVGPLGMIIFRAGVRIALTND